MCVYFVCVGEQYVQVHEDLQLSSRFVAETNEKVYLEILHFNRSTKVSVCLLYNEFCGAMLDTYLNFPLWFSGYRARFRFRCRCRRMLGPQCRPAPAGQDRG